MSSLPSKYDFLTQAQAVGIEPAQADALWDKLSTKDSPAVENTTTATDESNFDLPHLFLYLGTVLVCSALTWILFLVGDDPTGDVAWGSVLGLSVVYLVGFIVAYVLFDRSGWKTPAGLMLTIAVCIVPLIVGAFLYATDLWPQTTTRNYNGYGEYNSYEADRVFLWEWTLIGLAWLAASTVAFFKTKFPLLILALLSGLYLFLGSLFNALFGGDFDSDGIVLFHFIAVFVAGYIGYYLDRHKLRAAAFWPHLAVCMALAVSLTALFDNSTDATIQVSDGFVWLLIGAFSILGLFWGVIMQRVTYLVWSAIGIFSLIIYLSDEIIEGVLLPLIIAAVGLAIIWAGVVYHRKAPHIRQRILDGIPESLRRKIPEK